MLDIATHLIQSSDPINLIMNKSIHKSYKVHVTRHELIGGEMEEYVTQLVIIGLFIVC